MKKKSPWIAAILNFVFWGLGYLYNYKRKAFGTIVLVSGLAVDFVYFSYAISEELSIIAYALTFMGIGFAYDAYKEAEGLNQRSRKK